VGDKIRSREDLLSCRQGSLQACSAMNNQTGKGSTPSSRSSLVKTDTTKGLFQVIVGSWKIRYLITEKEVRCITLSHLQEMSNGLGEGSIELNGMLLHMQQHDLETQFSLFDGEIIGIIEDLSQLMDPSIDTRQHLPVRFCSLKSFVQQTL
jgi:hypothetical protein